MASEEEEPWHAWNWDPEEYILLGSTYADTMVMNADGRLTLAYEWDEE